MLVKEKQGETGAEDMILVTEPPRSIGATSLKHLRDFAEFGKISLFEEFEKANENPELLNRAVNAAKDFHAFISSFIEKYNSEDKIDVLQAYIQATGMIQMYKDLNTDDSLDRVNNIEQLLSDLINYFRTEENGSLEGYLQQISLVSDIDTADTGDNTVKMMTLHAAKGLEFPVVFIAGMENGLFPMTRADRHPEELKEERRLFYVGITRAEQKLFLTCTQRRNRFGEYHSQTPSPFLFEIESKYLSWKQISRREPERPKEFRAERVVFNEIPKNESYSQLTPALSDGFRKGDKVRHTQFGEGTIELLDGFGTSRTATVYFKSVGRKKLILHYAKLVKL